MLKTTYFWFFSLRLTLNIQPAVLHMSYAKLSFLYITTLSFYICYLKEQPPVNFFTYGSNIFTLLLLIILFTVHANKVELTFLISF